MTELTDLKALNLWVGYDTKKIPKDPHTGRNAQTNNPSTWGTAAQAWIAKNRYRWAGVGVVFTLESGLVGVDLDDCFEIDNDGTRHIKPQARDIVQVLDSYTEYSPSRNGLHVICQGEIPDSVKRDDIGFEMYNELRYFTVTGNRLGDTTKIENRTQELNALYVTFKEEQTPTISRPQHIPNNKTNLDEVKKALSYLPVHQSYYDWLRALMAVHDAFPGNDGVRMIEDWSPGYKGEVERKFRSFERTAKDGVTIGTLFHMAKENGYIPPRRQGANGYKRRMSNTEIQKRLAAA